MTEEPSEHIQNTALRVARLLDKVIEEDHMRANARTEEERFQNTFLPPATLQGVPFEGVVEELVTYNEQIQRFEEQVAQVRGRTQGAEKRYNEAAKQIAARLPEDTSVMHEYGGKDSQLKGRYEIRNDGGDLKVIRGR